MSVLRNATCPSGEHEVYAARMPTVEHVGLAVRIARADVFARLTQHGG